MMRVAATSDLHGNLPKIEKADILLICGDIMPLDIQTNMPKSLNWLENMFKPWAESLPVDQVVLIAGNHDFVFERSDKKARKAIQSTKIKYLRNEKFTYLSKDGNTIEVFGTPYCKIFGNWAFMRDNDKLREKYSEIPEGIDILISHDAPDTGTVGWILDSPWQSPINVGNTILSEAIFEKKPKWSICGHIHSGNHFPKTINETTFVNVSYVDEIYKPTNNIFYFDYE